MKKDRLLIALDLDGTLLTERKVISPRTKQVLQAVKEQGHYLIISTGRPFRSSKSYYEELGLTTPIVNFNGALVHHPLDKEWGTYHFPLDQQVAQHVVETSVSFGVQNIMVEEQDTVFLHELDQVFVESFFDPDTPIHPLPQQLHMKPTSILIQPHEHNIARVRAFLSEEHAEVIDHRKWGAPWNVIEVIRSGISKAVGLERVCASLQIPAKNVIAFGDEDNDIEMLQFAGTGVAMGNAIPSLKEVANQVARTNDEDGIAHFLEKYVL